MRGTKSWESIGHPEPKQVNWNKQKPGPLVILAQTHIWVCPSFCYVFRSLAREKPMDPLRRVATESSVFSLKVRYSSNISLSCGAFQNVGRFISVPTDDDSAEGRPKYDVDALLSHLRWLPGLGPDYVTACGWVSLASIMESLRYGLPAIPCRTLIICRLLPSSRIFQQVGEAWN